MTTPYLPTTVKARGYFAESRPDGRWSVRGRGQRRIVSHDELRSLISAPSRKKGAAKQ